MLFDKKEERKGGGSYNEKFEKCWVKSSWVWVFNEQKSWALNMLMFFVHALTHFMLPPLAHVHVRSDTIGRIASSSYCATFSIWWKHFSFLHSVFSWAPSLITSSFLFVFSLNHNKIIRYSFLWLFPFRNMFWSSLQVIYGSDLFYDNGVIADRITSDIQNPY